ELRDELVATQEYGAKLAHGKDEAEARIEAVQALHTGTRWPGVTDKPICDACDQPWPCPTIRALDGDACPAAATATPPQTAPTSAATAPERYAPPSNESRTSGRTYGTPQARPSTGSTA